MDLPNYILQTEQVKAKMKVLVVLAADGGA